MAAAGETWLPVRDLLAEDRFAVAFVVETETGERPVLRFGDGQFGRAPPAGFDSVAWRRGTVGGGNIGGDTLARLLNPAALLAATLRAGRRSGRFAFASDAAADVAATTIAADLAARLQVVANPLPGHGASPPQPTLAAKLDAPQAFRVGEPVLTS